MVWGRSSSFLVVSFVFLGGIQIGLWLSSLHQSSNVLYDESLLDRVVQERLQNILARQQNGCGKIDTKDTTSSSNNKAQMLRFGPNMSYFAHGASRTNKDRFLDTFDYGIRRNPSSSDEALIIYSHRSSLPSTQQEAVIYADGGGIPSMALESAAENCSIVQVIATQSRDQHQCLAVVGQYESFTTQRWERPDLAESFRAVQSGHPYQTPEKWAVEAGQKFVRQYLLQLDDALQELKPLVRKAAKKNSVVVMVSNLGQADLLLNFVCSARARKLGISSVVVFATDQHARDIATELGLTVYYNKRLFPDSPTKAAEGFGDATFAEMMKAKIVSVHMVSALGYDVLFQDLDVVWYKSPLEVFWKEYKDFDIMFQDEGSNYRTMAPHSANTGFYFVRHNRRTRYMLQQMLYATDWVRYERSHQQPLNTILTVNAAVFGLRVKTLPESDFPGGAQFHHRKPLMLSIVEGKHTPWIFHMSWTTNRDDKILYMKQMGLWYLQQNCEGDGALEVLQERKEALSYQQSCCAVEPLISCHFQDKPSVVPCPDSPKASERGIPFWSKK